MAGNDIMKGHTRFKEVSTRLQSLTLSSPQSEEPTGGHFQRQKGEANALPPQDKSHSAFLRDQSTYEEEVGSSESYVGIDMHEEKSPAPAADRQYQVDGIQTRCESQSEETRCSSLPTTVGALEETANEQSSPTTEHEARTPETSESSADSSDPADSVENTTSESSGGSSLPWEPNLPKLESILPSSCSISSSNSNGPVSDQGSSDPVAHVGERREGVRSTSGSSVNLDVAEVEKTMAHLKKSLQGFLYGSPKQLETYLTKIVTNERDFGFYVSDKLKAACVDNVMCYRLGLEYRFQPTTPPQQDKKCGIFLCEDIQTKQPFILKKIMKSELGHRRLIGIEFLTKHSENFLPKVYGVYKDKETISIFEEYIEGGILLHTTWKLAQVRQLAQVLLSAVHFLHVNDLVHFDIKLQNLMVRNPSDPESLVLIDFESARHPTYPLPDKGYTLTYLPPWHEQLLGLQCYDQVLKTMDLWAVACVIIFFMIPSTREELEKERGVWSQVMKNIRQKCNQCSKDPAAQYCPKCKEFFLSFLKDNGHNILRYHLGHLMDAEYDDPNWKALVQVLKYLTDTKNIKEKHISIALSLIKGPVYCQPAIEFDHDIER